MGPWSHKTKWKSIVWSLYSRQKRHPRNKRGNIFLLTTKFLRKVEFFKLVRLIFEEQVSKVRKKWKTNVWNLYPGEKKYFFQELCSCARGGIFSSFNQTMRSGELIRLVRVKIEKKVSKVRKNWKTNVWNMDLGQKIKKLIFKKKCILAP